MTNYTDVFTGVDYVHGTFCIADSEAEYGYDEYVQECEDNEIEPAEENSHEFYMWCDEMAQADYECDMDNIKCHKPYNIPVTITGVLGLWDGKHEIVPVEMDSVYDAINKCYGRDINHIKAFYEDGAIKVLAMHHDGTNVFYIKPTNGGRLKYLYAE